MIVSVYAKTRCLAVASGPQKQQMSLDPHLFLYDYMCYVTFL